MPTNPGSTGTNFSYSQLRKLWIQAGGNKGWSYVMAAIAMAESGGNPLAHHVDSNGSIDYGLWQINTVHHYAVSDMLNPQQNAKEAVAIFNSSGPHAWSTYNNGAYKKYLPAGKGSPNIADPVPSAGFERIDQGVDYIAKSPVRALVGGTITDIVPFATGEGVASHTAIIEKFDAPVSYGGRLYYGGYYAEETPKVKKGQHIQAGQEVMNPGSDEIGFMVNKGTQFPPLIGGTGAGTQPTAAGKDYAAVVTSVGGPKVQGESTLGEVLSVGGKVAAVVTNPVGSAVGVATGAASSAASSAASGLTSGIESLLMQGFFIIIGLGLVVVGLALVAWTVMGKVGAPGVIGMAQTQMRIKQSGLRTQESQRASMVRESQAGERIALNKESGARAERRLKVSEGNLGRRSEKYVVKDKPNQVVRKKQGNPAGGAPRTHRG